MSYWKRVTTFVNFLFVHSKINVSVAWAFMKLNYLNLFSQLFYVKVFTLNNSEVNDGIFTIFINYNKIINDLAPYSFLKTFNSSWNQTSGNHWVKQPQKKFSRPISNWLINNNRFPSSWLTMLYVISFKNLIYMNQINSILLCSLPDTS